MTSPYCATGPTVGKPHHWLISERVPDTEHDTGVCRCCGIYRVFTNAEVKGSWATVWAKRKATAKVENISGANTSRTLLKPRRRGDGVSREK